MFRSGENAVERQDMIREATRKFVAGIVKCRSGETHSNGKK